MAPATPPVNSISLMRYTGERRDNVVKMQSYRNKKTDYVTLSHFISVEICGFLASSVTGDYVSTKTVYNSNPLKHKFIPGKGMDSACVTIAQMADSNTDFRKRAMTR